MLVGFQNTTTGQIQSVDDAHGLPTAAAVSTVAPTAQTTTNAYVAVTGSVIDTLALRSVSYTIVDTDPTLTLKWKVQGANISDFSDAVDVQAEATITANGGTGSYSTATAPYRYYRVVVMDGSGHGVASVHGIAKG